jgi:MFS family permease
MNAVTEAAEDTIVASAARSLWRNRDYLILLGGQAVSAFGSQASQLALPLLILAVTGSPAQAGIVGALRGLAYLLVGLPAGALVDRWERKRLMVVCDIVRALALASIPVALVTGRLTVVQLYVVNFLEGTLSIFFGLAEAAALPRVVPREQLAAAVSQGEAAAATAGLVGPALGGALFGLGRALPFVADAVSYAVSAVSFLGIRTRFQAVRVAERRPMLAEIRDGVGWLWRQPVVRLLMGLSFAINVLYGGWPLLLIELGKHVGASPGTIGLLFSSGGAAGIFGAVVAPRVQRRFTVGQIMIGMAWVFAITWPPYALAPNALTLGLVNALGFFFVPIYTSTHYSYRLALVPDELQGRVNSPFRLGTFGGNTLGFLLMGALLEWTGPIATVWITFVPQVALAVVSTLSVPLRRAGRVAEV